MTSTEWFALSIIETALFSAYAAFKNDAFVAVLAGCAIINSIWIYEVNKKAKA